jgi:hypothetical protein
MKTKNSIKVFVLIALISGCSKKSDPDPRDAFVGSWTWHYTLGCIASGQTSNNSGDSPTTIAKGSSSSGVVCTFGSIVVNGTVSGGTITMPLQVVNSVNYSGNISFSGAKLFIFLQQDPANNASIKCGSNGLADKK